MQEAGGASGCGETEAVRREGHVHAPTPKKNSSPSRGGQEGDGGPRNEPHPYPAPALEREGDKRHASLFTPILLMRPPASATRRPPPARGAARTCSAPADIDHRRQQDHNTRIDAEPRLH